MVLFAMIIVAIALAPALASAQLAAMSIDLGSQFTKIGLVKVGCEACWPVYSDHVVL